MQRLHRITLFGCAFLAAGALMLEWARSMMNGGTELLLTSGSHLTRRGPDFMKYVPLLSVLLTTGLAMAEPRSPYTDSEDRDIKALSESEVEGYLSGKGMGQAMAAELNGYPGPKHVLELADELELSPEQRERTQDIFDRMQGEAVDLGRRIVEKERELDRSFASNRINQSTLESMLRKLFELKAQLRVVHLSAHLSQRPLLTPIQQRTYQELRGYEGSSSSRSHAHDNH